MTEENAVSDVRPNIVLINRSDQVGRPLAALLARAGYDVEAFGLKERESWSFAKGRLRRAVQSLNKDNTYVEAMRRADAVITGVPDAAFQLPLAALSSKTRIIIDFATPHRNVDAANLHSTRGDWHGLLASHIGPVTSVVLMENLVQCAEMQLKMLK